MEGAPVAEVSPATHAAARPGRGRRRPAVRSAKGARWLHRAGNGRGTREEKARNRQETDSQVDAIAPPLTCRRPWAATGGQGAGQPEG